MEKNIADLAKILVKQTEDGSPLAQGIAAAIKIKEKDIELLDKYEKIIHSALDGLGTVYMKEKKYQEKAEEVLAEIAGVPTESYEPERGEGIGPENGGYEAPYTNDTPDQEA